LVLVLEDIRDCCWAYLFWCSKFGWSIDGKVFCLLAFVVLICQRTSHIICCVVDDWEKVLLRNLIYVHVFVIAIDVVEFEGVRGH
jgi:hypothetical protein